MHPQLGDLSQVETVFTLRHQLEPFAVVLHHAVFNSVMHHLYIMPGPVATHVAPTTFRGEGFEDRLQTLGDRLLAADHQAVAKLQAPDSRHSCRRPRNESPS